MLVSTYHLTDTERAHARRSWIDARPVLIGRGSDCHLVIDDPEVAEHHLRISVRDDSIVIENLGTDVDVDGTPLAPSMSMVVTEGRPIRIGGTIVKVRLHAAAVVTTGPRGSNPSIRDSQPPGRPPTAPGRLVGDAGRMEARPTTPFPMGESARMEARPTTPMPMRSRDSDAGIESNPPPPGMEPATVPLPRRPAAKPRPRKEQLSEDPMEQNFLTGLRVQPGDMNNRMVYADWLEQKGLTAKAELVRIAEHLDTHVHRNASDVDWRAVVVRTPINHCAMNKCPRTWDALTSTRGDFVRHCKVCDKYVAFCGELAEVKAAAFEDRPVVFDIALDRVQAHAAYKRAVEEPVPQAGDDDYDIEDDPDGYTLDVPPSNYRR